MAVSFKKEVLVIIPARGGSKGIPQKNIKKLAGKPLIAYTIETALAASKVGRVVVSTDDSQIAAVAQDYGAEVPFLRPASIAGERAVIGDAIRYTVERLRESGYDPDFIITLYPTHLFRPPGLVDYLSVKLLQGFSPVFTGRRVEHNSLDIFRKGSTHRLWPLLVPDSSGNSSFKSYVRLYGLLIGASTRNTAQNPFLHPITDPISLIDIDTLTDFMLAEEIIKQNLFNFFVAEKK
jgi:GTP:adenosylcobinamide-phosphate guanylyltransferase